MQTYLLHPCAAVKCHLLFGQSTRRVLTREGPSSRVASHRGHSAASSPSATIQVALIIAALLVVAGSERVAEEAQ